MRGCTGVFVVNGIAPVSSTGIFVVPSICISEEIFSGMFIEDCAGVSTAIDVDSTSVSIIGTCTGSTTGFSTIDSSTNGSSIKGSFTPTKSASARAGVRLARLGLATSLCVGGMLLMPWTGRTWAVWRGVVTSSAGREKENRCSSTKAATNS